MRSALVILGVLAMATSGALAAEQPVSRRAVPGDAQDLVLFLESRPYLIRLHLQVNGRSFRGNWDESVAHLFRYLDVDGDGVLSKKEAVLAPSKTQWVQLMTGTVVEPDAAPEFTELAGSATATKATRRHFSFYYRNSGAGALQIEWGWRPPGQDRLSNTLFQQLDKDKDGRLSRGELLAARHTLRVLDANGDDLIQAPELPSAGYYPSFNFRSTTDEQPVPANFPFAIVQAEAPAATLAVALLKRYDRDKDGKCSRSEYQVEKAAFDRLDTNHDGRLDAEELAGWRKLPPELEFLVSLEQGARKDILLLPEADGKPNRLTALLPPSRDGAVRIPLAKKQLEVARYARRAKVRQELLKQFDNLAGKDGVLAEKRIYQPPFTFVALLRLADRNGDNRLSHKELANYLDVQEKFLFRTSYLSVVDRGASLFEFLDADHDGRLSPRELGTAWKRLSVWDRDNSGRIARQQVPRQFQLVLSYGQSRANASNFAPRFADLPLIRDPSRGPLWFRKMDRNRDGDVSQIEFLGTRAQFRRIDADGDGLIDVSEA
ncbi:MAG: EF-hand domain-containing protein, partial [Gemmataceae bacterium]